MFVQKLLEGDRADSIGANQAQPSDQFIAAEGFCRVIFTQADFAPPILDSVPLTRRTTF